MKQQNKMTFVTKALVLLLFCSMFCMCSGSDSESEPVEKVCLSLYMSSDFSAEEGDERELEIATNGEWVITQKPYWLSLSTDKGYGSSNVTVTTNSRNDGSSIRYGSIDVRAIKKGATGGGKEEGTISVTQAAIEKGEIDASPSSLNFSAEGGSANSKTITVKSNTFWAVTSNQSWCTVSPSYGNNNGVVTVTVSKNTSTNSRTASIAIKEEINGKTVTVSVLQDGDYSSVIGRDEYDNDKNLDGSGSVTYTLSVDQEFLTTTSSGESKTVSITSNDSWNVSSSQTWCMVSPASGTGNGNVTVKTLENSLTSRTATVTINGVMSGKKIILTVQQEGSFNNSIGRDEYGDDKKL